VGSAGFCGSSAARRLNAGDYRGACDGLLSWNRAQGRVVKGLVNRRNAERNLCLEGVIEPTPAPKSMTVWDKIVLFFKSIFKGN
jgi:hypothetical protein